MTTNKVFNLIKDYLYAFSSREEAIEIIFPKGLEYYTELDEEVLNKLVNDSITKYFESKFKSNELPSLFKKSLISNKTKKTFTIFDKLLANTEYDPTYEDMENIYILPGVKKYILSPKSKSNLVTQLNEFREDLEDEEIEDDSSSKLKYVIDTSDNYSIYLHDIEQFNVLTPEEEKEVLRKYKLENDQDAFNFLVECNQRLIMKVARKYQNRGLSMLDLIQEGNIGLIKGIEKFDITKGYKLSTYVTWWIRQSIKKAIKDKASTIRIPNHMGDVKEKVARASSIYRNENGEEPTIEELIKLTGLSKRSIEDLIKYDPKMISYDKPVQTEEDSGSILGDFLKSDIETPEELIEKKVDKEILETLLSRLAKDPNISDGKRSEQIIRLRFGIGLYNEETYKLIEKAGYEIKDKYILEDIGKIFGITRERIRQLEAKAIQALDRYGRSIKRELENGKYEEPVITKQKKPRKKYTYRNKDNKTE